MLDPDFGWHVRMGEVILESGIPLTDPFSYTMAAFPFVDHEWLTNVLMYLGYRSIGMVGLAAVFATLAVAALAVAVRGGRGKWWEMAVILVGVVWLGRGGVRPQVLDWLFLGGEWAWLLSHRWWKKWRWLMPVYLAVWANLHGGFALGVMVLVAVLGAKMVSERKIDLPDLGVMVLGAVATFINPYGGQLWWEVWSQASESSFFRRTVAEWQPWYAATELGFWLLGAMSLVLMWRYRRKFDLRHWGMWGGFLVLGTSTLRHAALFAAVAGPMLVRGWELMEEEFSGEKEKKARVERFYKLVLAVVGIVAVVEGGGGLAGARQLTPEKFYPEKALEWIKVNPTKGEIFSSYGWGGYLIWKLPERRVFVDGRMAGWQWKSPYPDQADWIFKDYIKMIWGEADIGPYLEKYGVGVVLWPVKKEKKALINLSWLGKKDKGKGFDMAVEMEKLGWALVYTDDTAEIYLKP